MISDPQFTEAGIDDRQIRVQSLGQLITTENQGQFEKLLRGISWSGVVEITDWSLYAIEALIKVCADENLSLTLKHEARFFMPIHFPQGKMLKSFAKALIAGNL
ncbi:MAG: hypothetical protein JW779_10205 [Candidatus Thorarchaeota archaeon]|nr:hypothetical protein [Candidatus Thorarchaeota archaeon]